ncbi:hypothetical protein I4F81_012560 [Pyropia yezoensis]|uniref:Uncharacterized protein n=1 Tax=Pyropia yezoensis TaxID=2788 RepID=A0ACC3CJ06_PYRYE|nr:hypothetical protein I4F81_012560 [Neopyropia yezoensis]
MPPVTLCTFLAMAILRAVAALEKPANHASVGVADKPESQVPPHPVGRKGKHPKKVKTAEEKLDALSTDFKALTKEWIACKGELITVRSMLATLTGPVNVCLENGVHVLDVVRHMAERPSHVEPPVDAAAVAPPHPVERPRSVRAQARLTMRWFKSLKEAFMSRYRRDTLYGTDTKSVYRGAGDVRSLMIEVVMSHQSKTHDEAKVLLDTNVRFHS